MFAPGPSRDVAWAQNIWFDPTRIEISSIGDASKALRAIQRNWTLYPASHFRRAHLIEEQLPPIRARRLVYPAATPEATLGSWTLLDRSTLIASARCSSPFPNGAVEFVENKTFPPNRAYLKLWELFTLLGTCPRPGEVCVDLGASPGGWSWVLHETGARVIAVDKAPLVDRIARLPRIEFRPGSAFALDPAAIGRVDWLFCDVVCYPSRLLALVERWLAAGAARRLVCTVKFQGPTDPAIARRFAGIPGSRLLHLHHNKHELTWIRL